MNVSPSKLFSIIIPVYNGEKYVVRCLSSIYSQGIEECVFEVIIVNDGSIDATERIVRELQLTYDNLVLITQENSGVSVARNKAVEASSGKFVIFMDVDDELVQSSLNRIIATLKTYDGDLLITNQIDCLRGAMSKRTVQGLLPGRNYSGIDAFQSGYQRMNAGGAICKRKFILEHNIQFPDDIPNGEDTIFFSVFQTMSKELRYEDIDFYNIHLEDGSASRRNDDKRILGQEKAVGYVNNLRHTIGGKYDLRIIEYTLYLLLSNYVNVVLSSKKVHYRRVNDFIRDCQVLPIHYTCFNSKIHKLKAFILNTSPWLFYYLASVKNKFAK